jgi:DNA-binding NtrC family response regulator
MAEGCGRILIADDEASITEGLGDMLSLEGYQTETVNDGISALKMLREHPFHLVLVDMMMPGKNGLEVLETVKKDGLETEVIIITGKATISTAVDAIRAGAYDYLTKPVDPGRLKAIIPKALERRNLVVTNKKLTHQLESLSGYDELVGAHESMRAVYQLIDAVADTTANVFITGESGTGKELVARAIHKRSGRSAGPFIAMNCSAFPRDILENELFGHEKGAFTGAVKEKPGCFEMADGGTLFLDEIGEMPADTQSKLLRVLEDKRFRRLGGTKELTVDVRFVSATNVEVSKALEQGTLREDLYFRLSVMDIEMPSLRNRISDLGLLLEGFLDYFNKKNDKRIQRFSSECLDLMRTYLWPGNVRELRNAVERAVILCNEDTIEPKHLPKQIFSNQPKDSEEGISIGRTLAEIEKEVIFKTLKMMDQNKTKAAQVLGISLKTMHNKLNKFLADDAAN